MASQTDPLDTPREDSEEFETASSRAQGTPPLGTRTPPLVMSSRLYGEDIVSSSLLSSGAPTDQDFLFSPSLLSEATTPPSLPQAPQSLSPPPLNLENASWASAPTSKRRPPRAPNVNLRFGGSSTGGGIPKQPQGHHNRALSGGDSSILSGLTDTDYDVVGAEASKGNPQQQQLTHTRHISWDQQETFPTAEVRGMNIDIALDLQQPILDEALGSSGTSGNREDAQRSAEQPVPEGPKSPPPSLKKEHLLKLSEINEFEAEAETLILRSIESESASASRRTSIKSALFPTIPEEGTGRFEAPKKPAEKMSGLYPSPASALAVAVRLQALRETIAAETGVAESGRRKTGIDSSAASFDQFTVDATVLMATARLRMRAAGTSGSVEIVKDSPTADARDAHGSTDESATRIDDVETGRLAGNGILRHIAETAAAFPSKVKTDFTSAAESLKEDWAMFGDIMEPQKASLKAYIMRLLVYVILPSLCLACILFYGVDNPPTGRNNGSPSDSKDPSTSWWVLFIGVRHMVMLALAKASEFVLVNYLAVQSRFFIRVAGPRMALLCSLSKGWPCILFFLGLYDIFFLYGPGSFTKHWLYWQDSIKIFNQSNPAGDVTTRYLFRMSLYSMMLVGVSVTLKRFWTGNHLSRRLFVRYNSQLTAVMEKMLLVTEIALLCRYPAGQSLHDPLTPANLKTGPESSELLDTTDYTLDSKESERLVDESTSRPEIMNLLEDWAEPDREALEEDAVSIKDILQFRHSCQLMETKYPFSPAFGLASSRKNCILSAESLYGIFLERQNRSDKRGVLNFETLSAVAWREDNTVDRAKLKILARVFRPGRNGELTVLEWCKSCDAVYREMRFLSSSIHSASQIDRAYERILNCAFYAVLGIVVSTILDVSALELILSLSSIIIAFAFMIGPASSNYFEGILLILGRRPYDIGDRIAVSDVNQDTNSDGSSGWLVEKIDLFTTTVRFASTREVATIANGSLARSRIINMTRSDKAFVSVYLKFSVDEPYSKVKVFRTSVEKFIHDRPREWLLLSGFRATRVETDLGYIEYVIVLQHCDSWANTAGILNSKADVSSFCLELQKQLEMRYRAPALPVDLAMAAASMTAEKSSDTKVQTSESTSNKSPTTTPISRDSLDENIRAIAKMFEGKKSR